MEPERWGQIEKLYHSAAALQPAERAGFLERPCKPADFQPDGRYRAIDITADNKKYHVRARKGYYAPPQ